ncbi:sensor domain-containing phosphodiesterase [Consotaella salsifontis]|uniref:EAL domain, c-di-GMP-specific phosphodiesterase class I (Or its enzymatically inactive variant) n=1 Tax=Consotaella salsifontis TaxID=1365950 RepID=A0A1T4T976_9HYPH|nr:EAL domain-containing protein [Consotaella salsifontis]SKA37055.1 EAL domain, c-di-GMP-specific phosphodiesterase class I (or its enzymatically inactive variant) [Consotaella salsifontis]
MASVSQPQPRTQEDASLVGLIATHAGTPSYVDQALRAVRAHLGMDVAFISEFIDNERIFRHVDSATSRTPIHAGDKLSLDEGYCKKIVEGLIPSLIPDTSQLPQALAIAATHAIPIGAHLSVPLILQDGRLFGTFCCFSFAADPSLNERDLHFMRVFAELVAHQLDRELNALRRTEESRRNIQALLEEKQPSIVFQPVVTFPDLRIRGAEALSRFHTTPPRSPDRWFGEARDVGLRVELEVQAIRNAFDAFAPVWARRPLHLALNASPQTIIEGNLPALFASVPQHRLILEITEHEHVEDYDRLRAALEPLRRHGVKVAIDDAGSGYASMRHILNIVPDFIKLDVSLTRSIDRDQMRQALASALIAFGSQTGSEIIAEGVETKAELQTLSSLGVPAGQGYFMHRPMPAADLLSCLG